MKLWMDVMRDLEHLMNDYDRIFDGWAEGGVDGLVIGPLVFNSPKLLPGTKSTPMDESPAMTYDPHPHIYKRLGVQAPPAPEPMPEKRRLLEQTLRTAKDRGFSVWIFQAQTGAGPGGNGHGLSDEKTRAATCARMIDTLQHYPMADGAIMDGPEWGYEIAPHHMNHRSFIFHDLPQSAAPLCSALGYDYETLVGAKDRLFTHLHHLDPRRIRLHSSGGMLGAFQLLGSDPDLLAWCQFRVDSLMAYFSSVRECLATEMNRAIKLGVGPRSAAFAPLCGYDFVRLAEFMDVLLPKHYFFHRGFDGMLGTVYRYVETLCEWNQGLSDKDALEVVRALFGLVLPGVASRSDLEGALTPEFYEQVVTQETLRVLAAVDDSDCIVVPWLDTGRAPHDGDPMSTRDLRLLLQAAQSAGLQRFLYHHHGNLTEGEWVVISEICGTRWEPRRSNYQPPDMMVL